MYIRFYPNSRFIVIFIIFLDSSVSKSYIKVICLSVTFKYVGFNARELSDCFK